MTISEQARRYLSAAQKKINAGQYSDADQALSAGLDLIGNKYYNPRVIDDSGQKLSLADTEISQGNLDRGLTIKKRILEERLEMLADKECGSTR